MVYTIQQNQTVNSTIEKVWEFISNPANLNGITPPSLAFEIKSPLPQEMFNGLLIEYEIKIPLWGRRTWVTEIKHIRPHCSFVDEQRLGPYSFWYHYHEIRAVDNGVKILDHVTYSPPFSLLGRAVHPFLIRPLLDEIFDYRRERFEAILK
ncbi:SRPBCC family protein [Desulfocicer niacini]